MSKLETDFNEVVLKINNKLKEAAAAVNEANRLALDEANLPGLIHSQFIDTSNVTDGLEEDSEEMDDALHLMHVKFNKINVSELEEALQDAGWSTSSSYC